MHTCRGIVWIKCRQSGKCLVCGCGKLCKEYSRPPSKFSVCEDSALDCESKLLLARLVREYISLLLPYHLYCKPSKLILIFVNSVIIRTLNLECESSAGLHLAIGGCACWLGYTCQMSRIMHYCHTLCMIATQKSRSCLECYNVCQSMEPKTSLSDIVRKVRSSKLEENEERTPQGKGGP